MRIRIRWSITQMDMVERLILEARAAKTDVDWMGHQKQIGHSLHSIYHMASSIRQRLDRPTKHSILQSLRERADERSRARTKARIVARPGKEEKGIAEFDHRVPTTRFAFDPHIRGRILDQGITAGLLGDPAPGRSALDRKKAAEAAAC